MKCSHPRCNRGIGLVSHRRGWFGKELYCSRACCYNYEGERPGPLPQPSPDAGLFGWLFTLPSAHRDSNPVPAVVRVRTR